MRIKANRYCSFHNYFNLIPGVISCLPATFTLFFKHPGNAEFGSHFVVVYNRGSKKPKILWEGGSTSARGWGCVVQLLATCTDFRGILAGAAGSVLGGSRTLLPLWFWLNSFHKMCRISLPLLVLDLDSLTFHVAVLEVPSPANTNHDFPIPPQPRWLYLFLEGNSGADSGRGTGSAWIFFGPCSSAQTRPESASRMGLY